MSSITVRLTRGIEIVRIAKTAGFDMLYVDLEHSSLSVDATGQICMAALDAGVAPFVRVPANTGNTSSVRSMAARWASSRPISGRPRRRARWWQP